MIYEKLLFTESEANLGIMLSAGDGYCRVHICSWDPHRNTKYIPSMDRIPSAGLVPIGHCWGSFPRHCAGLALTHSFISFLSSVIVGGYCDLQISLLIFQAKLHLNICEMKRHE